MSSARTIFNGRGASLGTVRGNTEFYRGPKAPSGKIVLLDGPLTPEIALSLSTALGVAVSVGGVTSHGANILREFGVPCLVAVEGLRTIKEGSHVVLDCSAGTLEVTN